MRRGQDGSLNIRSAIIIILVIFVLFDTVLFLFYFLKVRNQPTPQDSSKISTTHPTQKGFISENSSYRLSPGETRLFKGDPDRGLINEVLLAGSIRKEPFFNEETQQVIATVSFPKKNNSSLIANVVLGKREDKISTAFAKKGHVEEKLYWRRSSISGIISHLKKNDPVLLRIYYQKNPKDFIKDSFSCDASCKEFLDAVNNFYENNSSLIQGLKGEVDIKNTLTVGPVAALIIYASE